MSSPSRSEIETTWKNAVFLLDRLHNFTSQIGASNYVTLEDTFLQSLESDFAIIQAQAVQGLRGSLDSGLGLAASIIRPHIQSYLHHDANSDKWNKSDDEMIDALFEHFVDNSITVKERNFTFATASATGGNTGNGTIVRLNLDADGEEIESQFPGAKKATVITDQNNGAPLEEEVFRLENETRNVDRLDRGGSGEEVEIAMKSPGRGLVLNGSFEEFSGAAASVTDVTNWTPSVAFAGDGSDFAIDETNTYAAHEGVATAGALQIKATREITQKIDDTGVIIDKTLPIIAQISYNSLVGQASGTLVIAVGTTTATVAVASGTDWSILRLALDKNLWYKNMKEDDLDIRINWTQGGGSFILVDYMIVDTMDRFENGYYAAVPNATSHISFLLDDEFTFTDTIPSDSIIQKWFVWAFDRYLPASNVASFTDPS